MEQVDDQCNNSLGEDDKPTHGEANLSSQYVQYYKNSSKTMESSLQQRRETFLTEHKEKHNARFDEQRDLSTLFEEIEENQGLEEDMEVENIDKIKKKKRIRFKITQSVWFTDVPDDLADKWLVKFCPEGKRRLIVSNRRITKCFNKFGQQVFQFNSNLPGGGKFKKYSERSGLTVLDCVLHQPSKTFFVLDMMVWNSVSFLGCEAFIHRRVIVTAELRHSWIRSKFLEFSEFFEPYENEPYTFKVLFDYIAAKDIIESEMFQYDSKCQVMCEGLLFYHKEAPYISDHTVLVTWLKPFMLTEKLQIKIPIKYEEKRPQDYIDLQSYLFTKCDKKARTSKKTKDKSYLDLEEMET